MWYLSNRWYEKFKNRISHTIAHANIYQRNIPSTINPNLNTQTPDKICIQTNHNIPNRPPNEPYISKLYSPPIFPEQTDPERDSFFQWIIDKNGHPWLSEPPTTHRNPHPSDGVLRPSPILWPGVCATIMVFVPLLGGSVRAFGVYV